MSGTLVTEIADRSQNAGAEFALNGCRPGGDIHILTVSVQIAGRHNAGSRRKKWAQRIRESGRTSGRERIALDVISFGKILIVLLSVAVINPRAGAKYRLAMGPGEGYYPRIEIVFARIGEYAALWAAAAAGRKIERYGAIILLMKHIEERITQTDCKAQP